MFEEHANIAHQHFGHALRPRLVRRHTAGDERRGDLPLIKTAEREPLQLHFDEKLVAVHHRPNSNRRIGRRVLADHVERQPIELRHLDGQTEPGVSRFRGSQQPVDELKLLGLRHPAFGCRIHDVLCQIDLVEHVLVVFAIGFRPHPHQIARRASAGLADPAETFLLAGGSAAAIWDSAARAR